MKTWTEWLDISEPNDNLSLPINKQQYHAIQKDALFHAASQIRCEELCVNDDCAGCEDRKRILDIIKSL